MRIVVPKINQTSLSRVTKWMNRNGEPALIFWTESVFISAESRNMHRISLENSHMVETQGRNVRRITLV